MKQIVIDAAGYAGTLVSQRWNVSATLCSRIVFDPCDAHTVSVLLRRCHYSNAQQMYHAGRNVAAICCCSEPGRIQVSGKFQWSRQKSEAKWNSHETGHLIISVPRRQCGAGRHGAVRRFSAPRAVRCGPRRRRRRSDRRRACLFRCTAFRYFVR